MMALLLLLLQMTGSRGGKSLYVAPPPISKCMYLGLLNVEDIWVSTLTHEPYQIWSDAGNYNFNMAPVHGSGPDIRYNGLFQSYDASRKTCVGYIYSRGEKYTVELNQKDADVMHVLDDDGKEIWRFVKRLKRG